MVLFLIFHLRKTLLNPLKNRGIEVKPDGKIAHIPSSILSENMPAIIVSGCALLTHILGSSGYPNPNRLFLPNVSDFSLEFNLIGNPARIRYRCPL